MLFKIYNKFFKRYRHTFYNLPYNDCKSMEQWCLKHNLPVIYKTDPELDNSFIGGNLSGIEMTHNWYYANVFGFKKVKFIFKNPDHLLLFKLTWGNIT